MNIHAPPRDRREQARMVRRRARQGELTGQTSGYAPGMVQGNLAVLPKAYADDFLKFCQLNPKPCPVEVMIAVWEWGEGPAILLVHGWIHTLS